MESSAYRSTTPPATGNLSKQHLQPGRTPAAGTSQTMLDHNQIYLNGICYNYYGILIYSGSRNTFDSNSLIKNTNPAIDYDPTNLSQNNFWSGQDCANPYVIPGGGNQKDSTPICQPNETAAPCGCGVGTICGYKWNDLNGDGKWSSGEIGLSGWNIKIESPTDPTFVPMSTMTSKDGSYCFFGLKAGSYSVSETQKQGWTQTFPPAPGTYSSYLHDSEAMHGINFGNTSWCPNPSIIVEKEGPIINNAAWPISFGYRVTNNGNVPLTNITVTDDRCSNPSYNGGDANRQRQARPGRKLDLHMHLPGHFPVPRLYDQHRHGHRQLRFAAG